MRIGNGRWTPIEFGAKCEYLIHFAEDLANCLHKCVDEVLIPADFSSHINVYERLPLKIVTDDVDNSTDEFSKSQI